MAKKIVQLLVSLFLAGFFIWLSLREIDAADVMEQIKGVNLGWLLLFIPLTLLSHYLRALRWDLLLAREKIQPSRLTLFSGVMFGYFMNLVFPRLGEVSRPVYVARKLDVSSGMMIGTILLERLIDILFLILLFYIVVFTLVGDPEVLSGIFGRESLPSGLLVGIALATIALPLGLTLLFRFSRALSERLVIPPDASLKDIPLFMRLLRKVFNLIESFSNGIQSIRYVPNWPLFVGYSLLIWVCYILMMLIPFGMLDFGPIYGLGLKEATIVTMISSIGIVIPTPAGIGTYHLFVQQALFQLYGIPLVDGLTFATVTHGVTVLIILVSSPILLWMDKNRDGLGSPKGT